MPSNTPTAFKLYKKKNQATFWFSGCFRSIAEQLLGERPLPFPFPAALSSPGLQGSCCPPLPSLVCFYHLQVLFPQPPRCTPTDAVGTRRRGGGFSAPMGVWFGARGLVELAAGLLTGEGDQHPVAQAMSSSCCSDHQVRGGTRGPGAPQGG